MATQSMQANIQEAQVLHSDRGCQFTSDEYQRFLKGGMPPFFAHLPVRLPHIR